MIHDWLTVCVCVWYTFTVHCSNLHLWIADAPLHIVCKTLPKWHGCPSINDIYMIYVFETKQITTNNNYGRARAHTFTLCSNNSSNSISRVAHMPVERYASEYNMKHGKRGMAIIFNHEHFEVMSLKARAGTNVDCENLRNTLDRLHFDVTVLKDLRFADIQHHIEQSKLCIWNLYS